MTGIHPETRSALQRAADALEVEANKPKNKKYRHAFLLVAAGYRTQAQAAVVEHDLR